MEAMSHQYCSDKLLMYSPDIMYLLVGHGQLLYPQPLRGL